MRTSQICGKERNEEDRLRAGNWAWDLADLHQMSGPEVTGLEAAQVPAPGLGLPGALVQAGGDRRHPQA